MKFLDFKFQNHGGSGRQGPKKVVNFFNYSLINYLFIQLFLIGPMAESKLIVYRDTN